MLITNNLEYPILFEPASLTGKKCNTLYIVTGFTDCGRIMTHLIALKDGTERDNKIFVSGIWTGMDLHKRAKCGIICISGIEKGYHNGKGQVQRRNEVANRQVRA